MEFWPRRQAQWLNIWVGTGAGYMMAKGNEYGIYFNTTITENGTSKPATGDINIDLDKAHVKSLRLTCLP
jgi:hypothetical protein